ncbi:MAG: BrnT family toxin [Cyanobacteria bacterium P01_F01_bin.86]
MGEVRFEWDPQKAESNRKKHGISFEEAKTAFYDDNARLIHDPEHSQDEDRYILLGLSQILRLLIVCHVYRENDEVIRIISARPATKAEYRQYEEL